MHQFSCCLHGHYCVLSPSTDLKIALESLVLSQMAIAICIPWCTLNLQLAYHPSGGMAEGWGSGILQVSTLPFTSSIHHAIGAAVGAPSEGFTKLH